MLSHSGQNRECPCPFQNDEKATNLFILIEISWFNGTPPTSSSVDYGDDELTTWIWKGHYDLYTSTCLFLSALYNKYDAFAMAKSQ